MVTASATEPRIDLAVLRVIEQEVLPDGRALGDALEPWQRTHVLGPLLARRKGLPAHPLAWHELLKGAGKSTLGAAWAVAECAVHDGTWTDIAAIDSDQAGIIGGMAAGFVARTPALRRQAKVTKAQLDFRNGSTIRVLSADVPSAHGGGGRGLRYRLILDELALWPDFGLAHTLLASTGKVPDVQTVVLSNPGALRGGEAWRLRAKAEARKAGWHLYAPADGIKPGWITDAWRAQMAEALPEPLYNRFVLGRWHDGPDHFLTREQVLRCVDVAWAPQASSRLGTFVGTDFGLTRDRTSIYAVAWGPDQRLWVLNGWTADPREAADGEILLQAVEELLLMIAAAFPLKKVLCDPWNFAASRQRLQGQLPIQDFPYTVSAQERVSATLFRLIASNRVRLFPDDALVDELVALQCVPTPKGFRFDHRRGGHNDRAVALGMAGFAACEAGMPSGIPISDLLWASGTGREASTALIAPRPWDHDAWIESYPPSRGWH